MARGGKREGAGRPKGTPNKRLITDYWTEDEVKQFVEAGKDRYIDSDKLYIEFFQHLFGKPQQRVDLTTDGKELPQPVYVPRDGSSQEDSEAK